MEERKLDFERNKVEVLTLPELKQTYKEVAPNGQPAFGMYHFEVLERILEMFSACCNVEVNEIFAANNGDSRYPGVSVIRDLEPTLGKGALGCHTLRRVYANIETGLRIDDGITINVAFSYNQRGLQVGIGPNVHVCKNQTILGAQHLFSTYSVFGTIKRDSAYHNAEMLLMALQDYVDSFQRHQSDIYEAFLTMKNTHYDVDDVMQLFGLFLFHRVLSDTKHQSIRTKSIYPLNGTQINAACERFLLSAPSCKSQSWDGWELMNILNFDMKPDKSDIPFLLSYLYRIYFIMKKFYAYKNGEEKFFGGNL